MSLPSLSARLADEAVDFAALLVVWLLVGVDVGFALVGVLDLAISLPESWRPALVAGAAVVAVLELLDRRPTVLQALGFTLAGLCLSVVVVVPAILLLGDGPLVTALVDAAAVAVAAWLAFAGGYRWVTERSRSVLYRLTRTPERDR